MNRRLSYFNLAGVAALAVLCAVQWNVNRRLHLALFASEKTRFNEEERIAALEQTGRGMSNDLSQFKRQIVSEHELGQERLDHVEGLERTNAALLMQRTELMESVTNWARAVHDRDDLVKEANERIRSLSSELNNAILKFNRLATNYDQVVEELNQARTNAPASGH